MVYTRAPRLSNGPPATVRIRYQSDAAKGDSEPLNASERMSVPDALETLREFETGQQPAVPSEPARTTRAQRLVGANVAG